MALAESNRAPTRRSLSPHVRQKVWDIADGMCYHCGKKLKPFTDFHVDHLVPVSMGGDDHMTNLVASCISCNAKRGNGLPRGRVKIIDDEPIRFTPNPRDPAVRTLREWRTQTGMTVAGLARAASASHQAIERMESGYPIRRLIILRRICRALDVAPTQILEIVDLLDS